MKIMILIFGGLSIEMYCHEKKNLKKSRQIYQIFYNCSIYSSIKIELDEATFSLEKELKTKFTGQQKFT